VLVVGSNKEHAAGAHAFESRFLLYEDAPSGGGKASTVNETHGLHFWKIATGEPAQAEAKSGPAIDDQAEARADTARLRSEIAGGFSRRVIPMTCVNMGTGDMRLM
jgi:hypothetical protein